MSDAFIEQLNITVCNNIGFSHTQLPNRQGHKSQALIASILEPYTDLAVSGQCSIDFKRFLCNYYVPLCTGSRCRHIVHSPCRELCVSAKNSCERWLVVLGYAWPRSFDCDSIQYEPTCLESLDHVAPYTTTTWAPPKWVRPLWVPKSIEGNTISETNGHADRPTDNAGGREFAGREPEVREKITENGGDASAGLEVISFEQGGPRSLNGPSKIIQPGPVARSKMKQEGTQFQGRRVKTISEVRGGKRSNSLEGRELRQKTERLVGSNTVRTNDIRVDNELGTSKNKYDLNNESNNNKTTTKDTVSHKIDRNHRNNSVENNYRNHSLTNNNFTSDKSIQKFENTTSIENHHPQNLEQHRKRVLSGPRRPLPQIQTDSRKIVQQGSEVFSTGRRETTVVARPESGVRQPRLQAGFRPGIAPQQARWSDSGTTSSLRNKPTLRTTQQARYTPRKVETPVNPTASPIDGGANGQRRRTFRQQQESNIAKLRTKFNRKLSSNNKYKITGNALTQYLRPLKQTPAIKNLKPILRPSRKLGDNDNDVDSRDYSVPKKAVQGTKLQEKTSNANNLNAAIELPYSKKFRQQPGSPAKSGYDLKTAAKKRIKMGASPTFIERSQFNIEKALWLIGRMRNILGQLEHAMV